MKRIPSMGFTLPSFQEIDNLQFQFLDKSIKVTGEFINLSIRVNWDDNKWRINNNKYWSFVVKNGVFLPLSTDLRIVYFKFSSIVSIY